MYDKFGKIIVTIEDKVATITFNRPEVGNAFAAESYDEIRECFELMDKDDNVGAIVLTGAGKNFSAGGDIASFQVAIDTKEFIGVEGVLKTGNMGAAAKRCSKPVIAMINGAAAGAGAGLALACDFRFMTPKSRIIASFINLGMPGDTGCAYYLYKLVGMGKCTEVMMTGDPLGAEEAARLNVATVVEDESKLAEETYAFAKRLANGPTQGYKWQKKLFLDVIYPEIETSSDLEAMGMHVTSKTADLAEAVDAFLNKRKPTFIGK